jgi:hypothetical protein
LLQKKNAADPTPSWVLKVTPPPGVLLDQGQSFSPELDLLISVQYKGRTRPAMSVPIGIHEETVRRLTPDPEVITIPPAPSPMKIDGDLADWKNIPALRLASTGSASRTLKLAWDKDALYGAVTAEQPEIHTDSLLPWTADSVEINLEGDALRRLSTSPTGAPMRFFLFPDTAATEGKAVIHRINGRIATGSVESAWRKTPTGYTLEFRVSAKGLNPVAETSTRRNAATPPRFDGPLAPGRLLSLDLILRHDGETVEEFANTKSFRATSTSPIYWGEAKLSEK